MYLLSKIVKSKFSIPLLILSIFVVYFLSQAALRDIFVPFSYNFLFSKNSYDKKLAILKANNLRLKLKEDKFASLVRENKKLKKMLKFEQVNSISLIPLSIMSIESTQFRRIIIVEGGNNDNISDNMYVLDEDGFLIGKIFKVYNNFSEVILINDFSFSAPVKVGTNLGVLRGTLGGDRKSVV